MFTKKILALLLGISVLSSADAGPKYRVEQFLQKPSYQVEFGKLSDAEKKQLASDLKECYDTLEGVAVKKSNLQRLCEPYLDKGGKDKALPDITVGQKKKQYEEAAAAVRYEGPAQKPIGRIHNVVNKEEAIIAPPKQVIKVEGSIADRLKFFQEQNAQLQAAIVQKGIEKQNPRLLALKVDLEGLNAPLADARSAFERATHSKQQAEELNKRAAEDEEKAVDAEKRAIEEENMAKTNEEKAKGIHESVDVMIVAYGLNVAAVDNLSKDDEIKQKKQGIFAKYKILEADSAGDAERKLANAGKEDRAILAADMLYESKSALEGARLSHERAAKAREEAMLTRERSGRTKAEAEEHLKQATLDEANADKILKDLEGRYQAIAEEIASMK